MNAIKAPARTAHLFTGKELSASLKLKVGHQSEPTNSVKCAHFHRSARLCKV
jgi:hypothetical protein